LEPFVECCVVDDGIGSAAIAPTGGLKIVRALVDGLDTTIERHSSHGGTTWVVTFPRPT
jgi:two-component sensor histidine kinase